MNDDVHITLRPGQRLVVSYVEPPAVVEREAHTLEELAAKYPATVRTLRGLIASGKLPAKKVGRGYTVRAEDAERVFAPTVRTPARRATQPANDSDEFIAQKLRARGVRVGGAR